MHKSEKMSFRCWKNVPQRSNQSMSRTRAELLRFEVHTSLESFVNEIVAYSLVSLFVYEEDAQARR
jgi:hypothetical protein